MRASLFAVSAVLASVSLAYSVPHAGARHNHNHDRFHKRDIAPVTTQTVYVTDYAATVWVDTQGRIINTEFKTPPPTSATSAPATTTTSVNPSSTSTNAQTKTWDKVGKNDAVKSNSNAGGMGVCYDMIDSSSNCRSSGTINSDFAFFKGQGISQVRVYDVGCSVADYINAANAHGLKLMCGINGIANMQGDLAKLIGMVAGNWGPINTVYIGNELVNSGQASADAVAAAVSTARGILSAAGYNGDVITVDTFNQIQANPTICSTSSYCAANTHAFFDPTTSAENAGTFVKNAYNAMKSVVGGKRVVVTESGWPHSGPCNGAACPGADAQKKAMASIISAFSGDAGNLFLFQAYDAGYKPSGGLGVEQFFGLYDSNHYSGGY